MSDDSTHHGSTKIGEPTKVAVFYGAVFLGLLFIAKLASALIGDVSPIVAPMLVPILVVFLLVCAAEIRFHRMTLSNSGQDRHYVSRNVLYVVWPSLAVMVALLATLPLSIWYEPTDPIPLLLWFGSQSAPLSVWILVAGLIDTIATWNRARWSERACRLRLRGWIVVIIAQQVCLSFLEIAHLLAEGFKPAFFWAYIATVILVATTVIVGRWIPIYWSARQAKSNQ